MNNDAGPVSDVMLERFHLAELPVDEAARLSARLARDPELRARLEALAQSDRDIQDQGLVRQLKQSVTGRTGTASVLAQPHAASWRWRALAGACVVVIAAIAWSPGLREWAGVSSSQTGSGERIKGEAASLLLYRRSDSGSELLADGTRVRPGDLVRVAYRSANVCFGVIVSIDGRGTVTRHLPHQGDAAAPIQPGDATPLDTAYELDDAPKWERFFLVTGDRAFDVQTVIDAARRAAAGSPDEPPATLGLPPGLRQSSFLLRKVS